MTTNSVLTENNIILETPEVSSVVNVPEQEIGYKTTGIHVGKYENSTNEDVMLKLESLEKRVKDVTEYLELLLTDEFGYKIVK